MLRILAWRLLLSNNGIVNAILEAVGTGHVKMLNTPTAVVFGMVYDFLPFMILPIYNPWCGSTRTSSKPPGISARTI